MRCNRHVRFVPIADISEVYDVPLISHVATLPLMSRQSVLLLETLPASRRRAPLRIINR